VPAVVAERRASHGTQDICPTFVKKGLGLSPDTSIAIAGVYNIGAMIGGALLGAFSERLGRRRTIMSPDAIRGFCPGATHQLENLIEALNLPIQEALAERHGCPAAMAWTVVPVLAVVIVLSAVGKEAKGIRFGGSGTPGGPAPSTAAADSA
jgi:SHS family lactate transporter-like MFS transporter